MKPESSGNPQGHEVLQFYLAQALECANAGLYLPANIMLGSVLEALLRLRIKCDQEVANRSCKAPKGKRQWKLRDMLDVAVDVKWLREDRKGPGSWLIESRNYVHPLNYIEKGLTPPDEKTFRLCFETVKAAWSDLSKSMSDNQRFNEFPPAPNDEMLVKPKNRDVEDSYNAQRRLDLAIAALYRQIDIDEVLNQPTYSALWRLLNGSALQAGLVIDRTIEHWVSTPPYGEGFGMQITVTVRPSGFREPISASSEIFDYRQISLGDEDVLSRDLLLDALSIPRYNNSEQALSSNSDDDIDDLPW